MKTIKPAIETKPKLIVQLQWDDIWEVALFISV